MPRMRSHLNADYPIAGCTQKLVKNAEHTRPNFTTTNDAYAHNLYRDAAQDEEIETFLKESDLYDSKQRVWSLATGADKTDLLGSVFQVVSSIVDRFLKPVESTVKRIVLNSSQTPESLRKDSVSPPHFPSIVVQAVGPSFQPSRTKDTAPEDEPTPLRYSNIASYLSVKHDSGIGSAKETVDEMEVHARRIFQEQPNRFYIRSLQLTEKHARLVHFDRAGPQVTPLIDIHEHAATLVRLIVGLSSTNERLLGIDDSVRWDVVDGKEGHRTISTMDKTYTILEQIPIPRDSIRGRATTCWRVQDPETSEQFVIKDTWRPADRPGEHELLELVKGVPGVVQMVSCEPSRGEVEDFRCPSTTGKFYNRVFTRVVTKAYGKPIECFASMLEVLCALRDALAGLKNIESDDFKILHRDVSHNNILLGGEDLQEGYRGVLIDLDLAFRATDEHPRITADYNIGTRTFQSLSLLEGAALKEHTPEHDYLDDIESFFYVLCYIFLLHLPDGTRLSSKDDGPSLVWKWGEMDTRKAFGNKRYIFGFGTDTLTAYGVVEKNWGTTCLALFESFLEWMADRREEKIALVYEAAADPSDSPLQSLHAHRDEHFDAVLKMFDDAIEAIEHSETPPSTEAPATTTIMASANTAASDAAVSSSGAADLATPVPEDSAAPGAVIDPRPAPDSAVEADASLSSPSAVESPTPSTPPQVKSTLPPHCSSPVTPTRKRRSEDGEHPESPHSKARRVSEGRAVTSRSP
ncbi:hypothetical protein NMY22_g17766 [Coprinellus aureogranulatus]|nr:hypothetical protein NMY22_g17766 [Coprinellus aureogranulatus]